jgi:hypothetical protein
LFLAGILPKFVAYFPIDRCCVDIKKPPMLEQNNSDKRHPEVSLKEKAVNPTLICRMLPHSRGVKQRLR